MPKPKKTFKANINKLIDDLVHLYFKHHPTVILVDGFLHALVEGDPETSLSKFLKYNAPKLLRQLLNKQKHDEPV